jgi:LysM repeat protein
MAALAAVAAACVGVIVYQPRIGGTHHAAPPRHATVRRLPPYWIVRPGDTYAHIARKTGLTVDQLEAFNSEVDPAALVPGQRLNLWRYPPKPRRKPRGPLYWTVRPGDSFGLIAARTKINIVTLEQLNSRLKPASLQPGDRVRLRR